MQPQEAIVAISLLTTYRGQHAGISASAPWYSSGALIQAIWMAAAACFGCTVCCLKHCEVKAGTKREKSPAGPCRHGQSQGQLTASRPAPPGRLHQATLDSNAFVHMQQHPDLSREGFTAEKYSVSQVSSLFSTPLLLGLMCMAPASVRQAAKSGAYQGAGAASLMLMCSPA